MASNFKHIRSYIDFCTGIFGFILFITHFELLWAAILPFGWIFMVFDVAAEFQAHHYEEMLFTLMFVLLLAAHYKVRRRKRNEAYVNAIKGAVILFVAVILCIYFTDYVLESEWLPYGFGLVFAAVGIRLAPVLYDWVKINLFYGAEPKRENSVDDDD